MANGGRARRGDPSTSHSAAAHVDTSKLEAEFIAALKRTGHPMTTTEIARFWERPRDSFSPRARPLLDKGLIVLAGKRLCKNAQGNLRMMLAYRLAPGQHGDIKALAAPLREVVMEGAL